MIAIKLQCYYKMTSESNLTTRKNKINIRKMGSEYCFAFFSFTESSVYIGMTFVC